MLRPSPASADLAHLVRVVEADGRRWVLVGTAHVSAESAALVRRVIDEEAPERVSVELDEGRYRALTDRDRWASLDLKEVIRRRQLATLLVNLLLSAYQRRIGLGLGVLPGAELVEAVRAAEERGIAVTLDDRDVRITLRRAWRATPWHKKLVLASTLLASLFEDGPAVGEAEVRDLLRADVLSQMIDELGRALPSLKTVLIDERDAYIAARLRDGAARRVVAVVGAGHLDGVERALRAGGAVDRAALERVPPVSAAWKWLGWAVPAAIVGAVATIGWTQGGAAAGDNVVYWILANGIASATGAVLALAHPLTVATAFVAAPLTSLTPVIGAGYVTAFVQAYLRPPRVRELEAVADDVGRLRRWWENRLLRIFLAFVLPSLGSLVGTWLGAVEIFRNLLG